MTVIQHVELFSALAGRSRSLSVELADNCRFFTICTALTESVSEIPAKSRYIDIV